MPARLACLPYLTACWFRITQFKTLHEQHYVQGTQGAMAAQAAVMAGRQALPCMQSGAPGRDG